jgi:hypothetical protein
LEQVENLQKKTGTNVGFRIPAACFVAHAHLELTLDVLAAKWLRLQFGRTRAAMSASAPAWAPSMSYSRATASVVATFDQEDTRLSPPAQAVRP